MATLVQPEDLMDCPRTTIHLHYRKSQDVHMLCFISCGIILVTVPLLSFTPDETTIAKKEVRRTTFPNGTFSYKVDMFVTPALMVSVHSGSHCGELSRFC